MADTPVVYYNQDGQSGGFKNRWWELAEGQAFASIFDLVRRVEAYQSYRSLNNLRFARLYHNLDLNSLQPWRYGRQTSADTFLSNRVTLNVVKACVDTVSAKIGKSKPKPQFLTVDGDYSLQKKAKNLTQFLEGLFESANVYPVNRQVFVDACVFGTGCLYMYVDESNEIKVERVLIEEIVIDEIDGRYGSPTQLHRVRVIPRDVLLSMFPDHTEQIKMAMSGLEGEYGSRTTADVIKVIESWHLKSGEKGKDGKHTISISNCTLFEESYKKSYFPFIFQRWTPSLMGFFGTGLAEELVGIQLEINKLLRNIQVAQHLMAVPQVWVESSSKVVSAQINNQIGGIKKFTGQPPIFQVPPAMSAEVYQHVENLYNKAFNITGVSQLSASSQKPSGVTAAVAMRELSDIESERFMLTAQRYEESYMEIAKMAIDFARSIPSVRVKAPGKKFMEQISWEDVNLEEDQYVMKVWPVSLLPSSPAGKLNKVQEMMQAGFFDREDAIALLDFPDTEQVTSLITASRDDTLRMIDLMLEKGEYDPPEPYMNLQLALKLTQSAYIKARTNGYTEDRLDLLRRFMDDVQGLLQPEMPPPMPAAPGPEMPIDPSMDPMAAPAAQPVSDLLPVAQ